MNVAHAGNIPDPQYVSLVPSDTAAASDASMAVVRQQTPITREWLLAIHAQFLQHSRVGLSINNNPVLAAILTGRFKLAPNSPAVKPASQNVPALLYQYCWLKITCPQDLSRKRR